MSRDTTINGNNPNPINNPVSQNDETKVQASTNGRNMMVASRYVLSGGLAIAAVVAAIALTILFAPPVFAVVGTIGVSVLAAVAAGVAILATLVAIGLLVGGHFVKKKEETGAATPTVAELKVLWQAQRNSRAQELQTKNVKQAFELYKVCADNFTIDNDNAVTNAYNLLSKEERKTLKALTDAYDTKAAEEAKAAKAKAVVLLNEFNGVAKGYLDAIKLKEGKSEEESTLIQATLRLEYNRVGQLFQDVGEAQLYRSLIKDAKACIDSPEDDELKEKFIAARKEAFEVLKQTFLQEATAADDTTASV